LEGGDEASSVCSAGPTRFAVSIDSSIDLLVSFRIVSDCILVLCNGLVGVLELVVDDSTSSVKSSSGRFVGRTSADFSFRLLCGSRSDLGDKNRDGILGDLSLHLLL
jgi:hypothetical protein